MIQEIMKTIGSLEWPIILMEKLLNDKNCAIILFNTNLFDYKCCSLLISKLLGIVQIIGSCFYKLPVIKNIIQSSSGAGINLMSIYMETSSFLCIVIYNYLKQNQISTYGDNFSAMIQDILIILLIWKLGNGTASIGFSEKMFATSLAICLFTLLLSCPPQYYKYIIIYSMIMNTISKIPQIIQNFNGNTGAQSKITLLLAMLGVFVKLFIHCRETGDDILIIINDILAVIFNTTLFMQVAFNNPKKEIKME